MITLQKVRPGYKQTEAGVIPVDWGLETLGSLVRHHNAGVYKKRELYGRGSNIVGVSDLYGVQNVDGQVFALVPISELERAKYTLEAGDLLYGESSLVREGIARTVYVTTQGAGTAFAWHTRRYSINQTALISAYLSYYLQTGPARKHMMDQSIQTAITGINTVAYFACLIPIPPVAEQRSIAAALSDVDDLIDALDKLIAKKRELKQAAMHQLLTGECRLPGFTEEWVQRKVGQIAPLQRGFDLPTSRIKPGNYPVVYSNGILNYHCQYMVKEPGVVTGRSGTIGKVSYIEENFWPHNTSLWVTSFKGNNPKFIFFLYSFIGFEQFGTGSGVPTLNRNDVHAFEVSFPNDPTEQRAIATVLSDMDAEIATLEQRRDKTRALKHGMMQELLTGKTRLI